MKQAKHWWKLTAKIKKRKFNSSNMKNKNTPQELGKELVESSAVAGAVKREANAFKRGSFTINTYYCQTKTFYAGGDKLENGLSLFEIAEGMQDKFPNLIQKDVYSPNYKAFAFYRGFIIDAYKNKPTNCNEYESALIDEIYDFFILIPMNSIGLAECKTGAEYFVIHEGTHNHD